MPPHEALSTALTTSSPKPDARSLSSIASDILSGALKPTIEHIKALAKSVLAQGEKLSKEKAKNKKNKKKGKDKGKRKGKKK